MPGYYGDNGLSQIYDYQKKQRESAEAPRDALMGQAGQSGAFAGTGEQGFGALGGQLGQSADDLRALASGQNSVSAEQLRQALQQNMAGQQSFAAGASPGNAAMAARTAALGMGRSASGLAGQQAVAGLQERQQAQQALAQLLLQQRQQELQAALQGRANAIAGYTGAIKPPETSTMDRILGGIQGLGTAAIVASDRRAKTEISADKGDVKADALLKGLRAYSYRYKDERDGKGEQVGIMAQDLERVLPSAVLDAPGGKKYVHGARLASAIAASLPGLDKRLAKLEKKR